MGIENNSYGINIGTIKKGKRNSITDVEGVKVGHVTLEEENVHTGVTAILPHSGNIFREKVVAASHIINGFGKTIGTIQIDELGTIETPIILTNTLSVGTCATGLIKYMLKKNKDIGVTTGTINPVVAECNDGYLNDIRGFHVKEEHVEEAINNASEDFAEGPVGAGTGMKCYGLKGGIGTASRVINLGGRDCTVGALVLTNFGIKRRLLIDGVKAGAMMKKEDDQLDKGSVIIILATDIPVNDRQLKRLCKRVPAGLARTGSYYGNGSGDVVIGFTTANKVKQYPVVPFTMVESFYDDYLDSVFEAVTEATEEAVISSLLHGKTTDGIKHHQVKSITEYHDLLSSLFKI